VAVIQDIYLSPCRALNDQSSTLATSQVQPPIPTPIPEAVYSRIGLLHTSTPRLQEFSGVDIPQYAIISHRWKEVGEVTLRDLQNRKGVKTDWFSKIKRHSVQALSDRWDCIWIDCCCIDRSDDTELSESINSMFRRYSGAQVCYVYLFAVTTGGHTLGRP
jgi:hypothetical protein